MPFSFDANRKHLIAAYVQLYSQQKHAAQKLNSSVSSNVTGAENYLGSENNYKKNTKKNGTNLPKETHNKGRDFSLRLKHLSQLPGIR